MLTLSLRCLVPGLQWKCSWAVVEMLLVWKSSWAALEMPGLQWKCLGCIENGFLSQDWNPVPIMGNDVRGRENENKQFVISISDLLDCSILKFLNMSENVTNKTSFGGQVT